MKLELKHLAPYLPYKLMMYSEKNVNIKEMVMTPQYLDRLELMNRKPILRPLSDLDISDGRNNTPLMDEIKNSNPSLSNYQVLELGENHRYCDFMLLIKNHYDVFGLIEKGLAIDINTL